MNPSSSGWIQKFMKEFPKEVLLYNFPNSLKLYTGLRKCGFIYGVSIASLAKEPISDYELTREEFTKINLFQTLLSSFFYNFPAHNYEQAIHSIVLFYDAMDKGRPGFFKKLSFTKSTSQNLENILSARLQESNALVKTEIASIFTYALLYSDILAYDHYLTQKQSLKSYFENWEELLIQYSIWALDSKNQKNKYDLLVLEMLKDVQKPLVKFDANFSTKPLTELEKWYLLDICCLSVWDDRKLDKSELTFLNNLIKKLDLSEKLLVEGLINLQEFSLKNAKKIQLFEYAHPIKQLYKQSTETVKLLILRNKKRLTKELNESGELLLLLSQSTLRELSSEEKTKVKTQLLDVCKTIPSLTIFLLPGGTLLLPLLMKLIPKLLPSSFQDNQID